MSYNKYDYSSFVAIDNDKPKGGVTPYNSSPDNLKNDFERDFGSNFTDLFDWNGYDAITQLAYPGAQQEKEWLQQLFMQWYQIQWNSASAQMARAKSAGINLNLAAEGIVGASPSVGSSPNSAVGSGEGAADAAVGLANGAAQGFGSVAHGLSELNKLPSEIGVLDSQVIENLEKAGLNHYQSLAMAAVIPYLGVEKIATIWNMMADYDVKSQTYNNLVETYDGIKKDNKLKGQEIEKNKFLIDKLDYESQITALDLEIKKNDKWFSDEQKRFYRENGYLLGVQSFDNALPQLYGNKKSLQALADELEGYYKKVSYANEAGKQKAITNEIFNQAWNKALGENKVKAAYEPYFKDLERIKETLVELAKARYDNVGLSEILGRLMSEIFSFSDKMLDEGLRSRGREPSAINPIVR